MLRGQLPVQLDRLVDEVVDQRLQDLLLAPEVVIDDRFGDPGLLGDLADAGAGEILLREESLGLREDAGSCICLYVRTCV
jgi:hypothetical protein